MTVYVPTFRCRGCGHEQTPRSALALERLEEGGLCQGCRAARTLRDRPWLLPSFVETWKRVGFPDSDSWLQHLETASERPARKPAVAADPPEAPAPHAVH